MMIMWKLMMQAVDLARHRSLPKMRNLKTLKSILINSATHQGMDPLNIKVVIILTARSPKADPEVNLEANHLVGLAVLLPGATGFTLVTGLMPMMGVRTETTDQIVAHTIVIIMTGTITVMKGIIMTDIMTSTTVDMTGDMTEVDTGPHVGVLLIDLQIALGLIAIQMT